MSASSPTGFLGSLQKLGDGLLATIEDRFKLLSTELQEEKYRIIQSFVWISAGIFTAAMALAFASLALVYALWDTARLAALGGLALFYTAGFVAIVLLFRRYLARQPRPFADTLQELVADRTCFHDKN